jgi:serine/threonine-protein kinase RIO1
VEFLHKVRENAEIRESLLPFHKRDLFLRGRRKFLNFTANNNKREVIFIWKERETLQSE